MDTKLNVLLIDDDPGKLLTYEAILDQFAKICSRPFGNGSSRTVAEARR